MYYGNTKYSDLIVRHSRHVWLHALVGSNKYWLWSKLDDLELWEKKMLLVARS